MATRTVAAPRPAAVQAVLNRAHQWTAARRKSDGRAFFFIPGHTAGLVYMTDATDCTCPDSRERGRACKHSLAVRQHQARPTAQTAPAATPEPRRFSKGYHALFGPDQD